MTRPGRYPQELRERAVRLVFEHRTSTLAVSGDLLHRTQVRDVVGDTTQVGPEGRDR
jgi:hypothetical protein